MNRLSSILAAAALLFAGCAEGTPTTPMDAANVSVVSTFPASAATNAPRNAAISATFGTAMSAARISATTFTLRIGATPVAGTVTFTPTTVTFVPSEALAAGTSYTAAISTNVSSFANATGAFGGSSTVKVWSFTTGASLHDGPASLNLGSAGGFAILAKTGISTTGSTAIVGNIGLSPAAATGITGFALSAPPTTFSSSALVTGQVFAADYDPPTPAALTTAVLDMQAAYTDAAGRTNPDFTELGAGNVNGLTLVPGLYKWSTGLLIPNAVTLAGGADAVWIFQIAQDLTVGNGAIVTLLGGAQAKNVFWQVGGQATLGTTSKFSGTILSKTLIAFNTGAEITGRALAQTAVTLIGTKVTAPGSAPGTPPDTTPPPPGPRSPIDLGTAGDYVIFAKHAIAMNCPSTVTGNIGLSPGTSAELTGFNLSAATTFSTSPTVNGRLYAANYQAPTPAMLAIASQDLLDAIADATGRTSPNFLNLGAGQLNGQTLLPGLYRWSGGVAISGNITLAGGPNDVWIFQIGSHLNVAAGATVTLTGGAQAKNVFWQVTDDATLGANSTFQGIILSGSIIWINEGATLIGRALAYSEVRLCGATVTPPGTTPGTPTDTTTTPPTDTTTTPPTDTTTTPPPTPGLGAVDLRTAGGFCILAKTGVSTTGNTSILGDVGLSPAAATYFTGFALSAPATTFTTSARVTGQLFAADYDPPTPARLTLAVLDMEAAYTDAATRPNPNYTNLGAGSLTQGQTLAPGLYKWTTGLSVQGNVTLAGGPNAVWIFQIAQDLTVGSGATITLAGGAQAKNVFWQVSGQATLGTTSQFKGYILSKTLIAFNTGARIDGCALAQTAVTLDATTVTRP